jgi:ELWxxDGT repeat protein
VHGCLCVSVCVSVWSCRSSSSHHGNDNNNGDVPVNTSNGASEDVVCSSGQTPVLFADLVATQRNNEGPHAFVGLSDKALFWVEDALWVSGGLPENTYRLTEQKWLPKIYLNAYPSLTIDNNTRAQWLTGGLDDGIVLVQSDGTSEGTQVLLENPALRPVSPLLAHVGGVTFFAAYHAPSNRISLLAFDGAGMKSVLDSTDVDSAFIPQASLSASGDFNSKFSFAALPVVDERFVMALQNVETSTPSVDLLIVESGLSFTKPVRMNHLLLATNDQNPPVVMTWKNAQETRFLVAGTDLNSYENMHEEPTVQLWITDGIQSHTQALMPVGEQAVKGYVHALHRVGETVYVFIKQEQGYGVWRTDGTVGGTASVMQLDDSCTLRADNIMASSSAVYFVACQNSEASVWELSALHPAGHALVRSAVPNSYGVPLNIEGVFQDTLLFWWETPTHHDLYSLALQDTLASPVLHPVQRYRQNPVQLRGVALPQGWLMNASEGVLGHELWRFTDEGEVQFLGDLTPGNDSGSPRMMHVDGEKMLFSSHGQGVAEYDWFLSDGVSHSGSTNPAVRLSVFGNDNTSFLLSTSAGYFFHREEESTGSEVWFTDGTPEGTFRVADIYPGEGSSEVYWAQVLENRVVFQANDADHGSELWGMDIDGGNVELLADTYLGEQSGYPSFLTAVPGAVLFFTQDEAGSWLWRSDGTASGTYRLEPSSVTTPPFRTPGNAVAAVHGMYFLARVNALGRVWWWTDGTLENTYPVAETMEGVDELFHAGKVVLGDDLITLMADTSKDPWEYQLWAMHGAEHTGDLIYTAPVGQRLDLIETVGNKSYFINTLLDGDDEAPDEKVVWASDGTPQGTQPWMGGVVVSDVVALPPSPYRYLAYIPRSQPKAVHVFDAQNLNNTPQGVTFAQDVEPHLYDAWMFRDALFLQACDASTGCELWCAVPASHQP